MKDEASNDSEPQKRRKKTGVEVRPRNKVARMSHFWASGSPKALVIVPWSSELVTGPGVSTLRDESERPVYKSCYGECSFTTKLGFRTARPAGRRQWEVTASAAKVAQRRKPEFHWKKNCLLPLG